MKRRHALSPPRDARPEAATVGWEFSKSGPQSWNQHLHNLELVRNTNSWAQTGRITTSAVARSTL